MKNERRTKKKKKRRKPWQPRVPSLIPGGRYLKRKKDYNRQRDKRVPDYEDE